MRKIAILLLLFVPSITFSQTIKINAGASFSTVLPPRGLGVSTGLENVTIGPSLTLGIDYLETKWGFLSSHVGLVQKGRTDIVDMTSPDGFDLGRKRISHKMQYLTFNTTMSFKLSQKSLIPFFSIGPRVDYMYDGYQYSTIPRTAFGFNGGFGVIKRKDKFEFGGRIDYLLNLKEHPRDRTGTVMTFLGYTIGKK